MTVTKTQFIPAGRTGLVVKGEFQLQVQTEYSPRPIPRITSSILCSGELLHRVDVPLDDPIESQEDTETAERLIMLQHGEVLKIVKEDNFGLDSEFPYRELWLRLYPDSTFEGTAKIDIASIADLSLSPEGEEARELSAIDETDSPAVTDDAEALSSLLSPPEVEGAETSGTRRTGSLNIREYREPKLSDSDKIRKLNRTTLERLYSIDGVEKIIPIEWHGKFLTDTAEKEFKRQFKAVYKQLDQALDVFPPLAGGRGREEGIYEVESRRLYMVSHCAFVYFVIMRQLPFSRPIEDVIREALKS